MKRHLRTHIASPHRLPVSISACIAALISVALPSSTALALPGDMNCDGAVNVADIPLFVNALLANGTFGGCDINRADMNADSRINGLDTQPFVAALLHPCGSLTLCGGVCVDTSYDNGNCGNCGHHCSVDETCVGGICEPSQPCDGC